MSYNGAMRRPLTFAAFLLIVSVMPVCAQRGGGGHASGGGSHGGFSGGHASFSGSHASGGFAGHSVYAAHGALGAGSGYTSHYASRPGSVMGSRSYGRGPYIRSRVGLYGYRNRGYYGYPYYGYYAGIDPYWWWDTYPSDDADQRAMADEMNQENLEEQQALRDQDQDVYARRMPRAEPPAEKAENDPATILIFRDQHTREVQNYAIVDEMLWVFSPSRIEKVPLATLDVPATIKANENRGVDFRLPGVNEGQ
jgi:hypothetical protein